MKSYTIMKKPESLDWACVPIAPIDIQLQKETVDILATAQVCYDEEALYVHLVAKEKNIRAEYTDVLSSVCKDSCLEFFFSPIWGDDRYFNIEYNPNCCIYLGIGSGIHDSMRIVPGADIPFSPKAIRTEDGWEITYQVPFEFIRRFFPTFAPTSGTKMRGNFYKCGDLTVQPHYLCWNMITSNPVSFHRPCDYGILEFE